MTNEATAFKCRALPSPAPVLLIDVRCNRLRGLPAIDVEEASHAAGDKTIDGSMEQTMKSAVARVLKRLHYPIDAMIVCRHWCVANPLSLRHLEEMVAARGIAIDL